MLIYLANDKPDAELKLIPERYRVNWIDEARGAIVKSEEVWGNGDVMRLKRHSRVLWLTQMSYAL
jgi:hypothetical protein